MKKSFFICHILFFICLLACSFLACEQDHRKDIEPYYFPVKKLKKGKVYEYRPIGQDSIGSDYWYYFTLREDGNTYFLGNYYDAGLNVRQFFREKKVHNGMLLEDLKIYGTDSLGKAIPIPVEIQANNSYPFKVSNPSGVFLYKVKWNDPFEKGSHTTLIRNRRYLGDTTYTYQGKEYDCIQLELRELIENFKVGDGYTEPEYKGIEIYAEGIGLVYYRKEISDALIMEYELTDIYTMEELEKKLGQ